MRSRLALIKIILGNKPFVEKIKMLLYILTGSVVCLARQAVFNVFDLHRSRIHERNTKAFV